MKLQRHSVDLVNHLINGCLNSLFVLCTQHTPAQPFVSWFIALKGRERGEKNVLWHWTDRWHSHMMIKKKIEKAKRQWLKLNARVNKARYKIIAGAFRYEAQLSCWLMYCLHSDKRENRKKHVGTSVANCGGGQGEWWVYKTHSCDHPHQALHRRTALTLNG